MALSVGIVGLPNVGKSTLFAALTQKEVDRQNYPFCTIDPNVGVVAVPDERVDVLAELSGSEQTLYATIEFTDIAGLVAGAHKGEGLGNQFLSHIREVDALVYVLRAFEKQNITRVAGSRDPASDKQVLDTEFILKDLETITRRAEKVRGGARTGDKAAREELAALEHTQKLLEDGVVIAEVDDVVAREIGERYQLLSAKPRLNLLNGSEHEVREIPDALHHTETIVCNILDEYEGATLTPSEREEAGLPRESGLTLLIRRAYELLDQITFLTTGTQETRAWTVTRGMRAPQAAGVIHTDFEKKFIRADVINWKTLREAGGWTPAREQGLVRSEGKEYVVRDGDVLEVKHG